MSNDIKSRIILALFLLPLLLGIAYGCSRVADVLGSHPLGG